MTSSKPLLEVNGLTLRIGSSGRTVVNDVSFCVAPLTVNTHENRAAAATMMNTCAVKDTVLTAASSSPRKSIER